MDKGLENSSCVTIQGFTILQVKADENCTESQCLYLKPHTSQLEVKEWPKGRTLQVHNIPPYCNEANLKLLFSCCGKISKIYFQDKLTSIPQSQPSFVIPGLHSDVLKKYKIAYVVFTKPESLQKACKLTYKEIQLLSNEVTPLYNVGVSGFIKEYQESIIDVQELEKGANDFLLVYYKKQDEKEDKEKSMEGVPDEDGFIKVTRHGKNKGAKRTEQSEKRGRDRHRQRKMRNELTDFYKFQFRETKRQHIAELQKKFEEDKKRVQEMKSARKFKPAP